MLLASCAPAPTGRDGMLMVAQGPGPVLRGLPTTNRALIAALNQNTEMARRPRRPSSPIAFFTLAVKIAGR